ncbi:hypothetical protein [Roseimicrobium gellanilyticum]|uniref:hypothetical protein n=1 Tax=Roseimicrobium gellanilyticum TaxID=748857 RepID=UPI0011BF2DD6|nr:hypothetical protein [Roseimicrobium gellanilyticum]
MDTLRCVVVKKSGMNMEYHRERLQWALQALALPAQAQRRLFPPEVCVPDELVLNFDEHWHHVDDLAQDQMNALVRLDEVINHWSGIQHPDVWEDAALDSHHVWFEFRALAQEALRAFDWPVEEPPPDPGKIYVV